MRFDKIVIEALISEYEGQLMEYEGDFAKILAEDGEITISFRAKITDAGERAALESTLSATRCKVGGEKVSGVIDPRQKKLPME
jgi:hypothetical protein